MALVAPRDERGQYVTERNPYVLFEIVREVRGAAAARRDPDPFKDSATVSQAAWNAAARCCRTTAASRRRTRSAASFAIATASPGPGASCSNW